MVAHIYKKASAIEHMGDRIDSSINIKWTRRESNSSGYNAKPLRAIKPNYQNSLILSQYLTSQARLTLANRFPTAEELLQ